MIGKVISSLVEKYFGIAKVNKAPLKLTAGLLAIFGAVFWLFADITKMYKEYVYEANKVEIIQKYDQGG